MDIQKIIAEVKNGNFKLLARAISYVENEIDGYDEILRSLTYATTQITGITGPPGAGKSTLTDAMIGNLIADGKKIAILCVDPSSPFNNGALLGDRVRMSKWYNDPNVFIRSFATRGSLGGLQSKMIEIIELVKAAGFDHIIVETVGVGQNEVEIAAVADTVLVVLVPEAGDDIQTMKAGLMEIADIFVVNKYDRPDAELFFNNLQHLVRYADDNIKIPIIKTIAIQNTGIDELIAAIRQQQLHQNNERKILLLAEKAYQLIANRKMRFVNKMNLKMQIAELMYKKNLNLYNFVNNYDQTK